MSKILSLYLDTSVIGAIFDIEDSERVRITEKLLDDIKNKKYDGYISNVTTAEIGKGPKKLIEPLTQKIREIKLKILDEDEESIRLADEYIAEKVVTSTYRDDARHIAIAVMNNLDIIVSWNYRHMVNMRVKRRVNAANLKLGYKTIDIITPLEVIEHE